PSRRRASSTIRTQPSGVATDSARTSTGASRARSASSLSVRETPKTRSPRAASASAVARPMPRPAPVTSATRPLDSGTPEPAQEPVVELRRLLEPSARRRLDLRPAAQRADVLEILGPMLDVDHHAVDGEEPREARRVAAEQRVPP